MNIENKCNTIGRKAALVGTKGHKVEYLRRMKSEEPTPIDFGVCIWYFVYFFSFVSSGRTLEGRAWKVNSMKYVGKEMKTCTQNRYLDTITYRRYHRAWCSVRYNQYFEM